ncbi:DUF4232 domain-containing protein [Streptomyces justiciae]|uniref:DUF4232 domain-containing protein n=1 Tax=Streptomyces justiciae TaxID=2780140 RepID=UPI0021173294|nr:DUF4232 domain-containing protein [Streptomyces justiciae]MCW8376472.1 DUF4232 domain-containing protein [Streptomyces justiciae]
MSAFTVLALTATLLTAAPASPGASPACPERALTLRAEAAAADPAVVRVSVTNRGDHTCTVARTPTVTFADLDGSAQPMPEGATGRYRLGAGGTAYATVRTVADPSDPQARRVDALAVSADPARWGRAFTAAELGTGDTIRVWEPVTSWWQISPAAADRALGLG